jgi:hypothetical protein
MKDMKAKATAIVAALLLVLNGIQFALSGEAPTDAPTVVNRCEAPDGHILVAVPASVDKSVLDLIEAANPVAVAGDDFPCWCCHFGYCYLTTCQEGQIPSGCGSQAVCYAPPCTIE